MAKLLIDAREFVEDRFTGIGRFLSGLIDALIDNADITHIELAVLSGRSIPRRLLRSSKVEALELPRALIHRERFLVKQSAEGYDVFISPYPKLPLSPVKCPTIHTVHDVLYISHPAYKKNGATSTINCA